jgi:hypothetical protein
VKTWKGNWPGAGLALKAMRTTSMGLDTSPFRYLEDDPVRYWRRLESEWRVTPWVSSTPSSASPAT